MKGLATMRVFLLSLSLFVVANAVLSVVGPRDVLERFQAVNGRFATVSWDETKEMEAGVLLTSARLVVRASRVQVEFDLSDLLMRKDQDRIVLDWPQTVPFRIRNWLRLTLAEGVLEARRGEIVFSGDPGELQQQISIDDLLVEVQAMDGSVSAGGTLASLSGTLVHSLDGTTPVTTYSLSALDGSGSVSILAENRSVAGGFGRIALRARAAIPRSLDLPQLIEDRDFDVTTRVDGAEVSLTFSEGDAREVVISTANAEGDLGLASGAARFEGKASSLLVTANAPTLRWPLDFVADAVVVGSSLPLFVSDTAEIASLEVDVGGIEPSAGMWDALDPGGAIQRGPSQFTASGQLSGKWTKSPFDADTDRSDAFTAEQATLTAFDLSGPVAQLTGNGGVALADEPLGTLEFQLTGIIRLLNALAAAGALQPLELIGAQLGLGLLTEPGEDPDTYESRIIFGPDGAIRIGRHRFR